MQLKTVAGIKTHMVRPGGHSCATSWEVTLRKGSVV